MLQVVAIPDEPPGDLFESGLLLPVPGPGRNEVIVEPRDGRDIIRFDVAGFALEYKGTQVLRVSGVHAEGLVTDARVTIACTSYDKGGGWVGDPVSMVLLNAASKASAAVRSRGRILVGQVRYPWLVRVGSTPRAGFGTEERLVFDASESENVSCRMTILLPGKGDAAEIAAAIARRAAAYRLASEDLDADERRVLSALGTARPLERKESHAKNQAVFHEFPTYWNISEKSARLTPR